MLQNREPMLKNLFIRKGITFIPPKPPKLCLVTLLVLTLESYLFTNFILIYKNIALKMLI